MMAVRRMPTRNRRWCPHPCSRSSPTCSACRPCTLRTPITSSPSRMRSRRAYIRWSPARWSDTTRRSSPRSIPREAPPRRTVNVGVITQGSMTNVQSDFSKFLSQNGYPSIPLNIVKVNGGGTDTSGDGEWDLDTQDIVGISGGVKSLYLYDTPTLSDADLTADFNKAVSDNIVKVINVSIGGCETDAEVSGA